MGRCEVHSWCFPVVPATTPKFCERSTQIDSELRPLHARPMFAFALACTAVEAPHLLITSPLPRCCSSPRMAMSPAEQYAAQQARKCASGGGSEWKRRWRLQSRSTRAEEQKKAVLAAAVTELENQYARPLSIFNSDLFESEHDHSNGGQPRRMATGSMGKGEEAPLDFTYGEFPLALFTKLVDRACALGGLAGADRSSLSMADLGSGTGRLALWAAATSQPEKVSGIEYLPTIAEDAQAKLFLAKLQTGLLQTEDVQLIEGSWDDPTALEWSELDFVLAHTTAITARMASSRVYPPRSPSGSGVRDCGDDRLQALLRPSRLRGLRSPHDGAMMVRAVSRPASFTSRFARVSTRRKALLRRPRLRRRRPRPGRMPRMVQPPSRRWRRRFLATLRTPSRRWRRSFLEI